MKIIETPVYLYAELDESGKEAARQWWIDAMSAEDYAEYVIQDATEIAERMGITFRQKPYQTVGGKTRYEPAVYWSGFCCQGDGASFEGSYTSTGTALLKVKEHAPVDERLHRIAAELDAQHAQVGSRISAVITTSGHYSHSYSMDFEFSFPDLDDLEDQTASEAAYASGVGKDVSGTLRDFADWIYRQLEQEYEYQCSEECVAEMLESNGYTFDSRGARFG